MGSHRLHISVTWRDFDLVSKILLLRLPLLSISWFTRQHAVLPRTRKMTELISATLYTTGRFHLEPKGVCDEFKRWIWGCFLGFWPKRNAIMSKCTLQLHRYIWFKPWTELSCQCLARSWPLVVSPMTATQFSSQRAECSTVLTFTCTTALRPRPLSAHESTRYWFSAGSTSCRLHYQHHGCIILTKVVKTQVCLQQLVIGVWLKSQPTTPDYHRP